ncbi:MAG: RpiB/LacA/LacB family sugar-phosphate isomerase [Opitutaceae bacterium]
MTKPPPRIAIDADDAAFGLKKIIFDHLKSKGVDITDLDLHTRQACDYPEIGYNLAREVAAGHFDRGILICGTGLGMAMIANKVPGVWAGTCHDTFSAERLIKSNDANVITFGERVIGPELAKMIVDHWLASTFAGGGSAPKVAKLRKLEAASFQKS